MENPGFVGGLALSPGRARPLRRPGLRQGGRGGRRRDGRACSPAPPSRPRPTPRPCRRTARAVYVSVWGASRVAVLEPRTLRPLAEIVVGEHPNAMAFSKDEKRLFVACANTNAVWVVDLASRKAVERIGVALSPQAPPGSTPNALALSPDGATLLVANADNNTVAVVDVTPARARAASRASSPPAGTRPASRSTPTGERVLVLSGKGLAGAAEPARPARRSSPSADAQYIGGLLNGALSVLAAPGREGPRRDDRARLRDQRLQRGPAPRAARAGPRARPIPGRVGDPSPIKHVFYVIRENRTYDQVLGDLPQGNGDPNLTLFGEEVTPERPRASPASSSSSTTSTSTPRSATTATPTRPRPTRPTPSRSSGRRSTASAAAST